jgi:peptidoglycan L-alanyl-D-glutamate endopeptidase CwlK
MAKFGTRSKENLNEAHIDLQKVFNEVIKYFDCSVLCGHRTKAEQDKAYPKYTKVKYPDSKHNKQPSMAVDVVPYPIEWDNTKRMIHFAGMVKGIAFQMHKRNEITHLIRWGGDWDSDTKLKDNKFQDYPHYEIIKPM